MNADTGSTAADQQLLAERSQLQRTIAVGQGQVRLKAVIHGSKTNSRTAILAHDGEADSNLLQSFKQQLLNAAWRVLEVQLVRDDEAQDRLVRYDIPLLARRLADVQRWAERNQTGDPSIIVGTGNAVAAALWLSTRRFSRIDSVLSVNGRPHLAEPVLGSVKAPTLLLVDAQDRRSVHMNRMAAGRLGATCDLREVEGAGTSSQLQEWTAWLNHRAGGRSSRRSVLRRRKLTALPALSLLRSLISIPVFFSLLTGIG